MRLISKPKQRDGWVEDLPDGYRHNHRPYVDLDASFVVLPVVGMGIPASTRV